MYAKTTHENIISIDDAENLEVCHSPSTMKGSIAYYMIITTADMCFSRETFYSRYQCFTVILIYAFFLDENVSISKANRVVSGSDILCAGH